MAYSSATWYQYFTIFPFLLFIFSLIMRYVSSHLFPSAPSHISFPNYSDTSSTSLIVLCYFLAFSIRVVSSYVYEEYVTYFSLLGAIICWLKLHVSISAPRVDYGCNSCQWFLVALRLTDFFLANWTISIHHRICHYLYHHHHHHHHYHHHHHH